MPTRTRATGTRTPTAPGPHPLPHRSAERGRPARAGRTARVPVEEYTTALRFPRLAPSATRFDLTPHFLLEQVRVPLAAFGGVDPGDVRRVTLVFDRQPTGALGPADPMFAR